MIAATGLRRDRLALDALLRRRGASPGTVRLLGAVEAAVPVLLGAALGVALGFAVGAVVGRPGRAAGGGHGVGRRARRAARGGGRARCSRRSSSPSPRPGTAAATARRGAWSTRRSSSGLAVVAARGRARARSAPPRWTPGTDPLLTVLPVLVVLCGGLLAARLWPVTVTTIGPAAARGAGSGPGWRCSVRPAGRCGRSPPSRSSPRRRRSWCSPGRTGRRSRREPSTRRRSASRRRRGSPPGPRSSGRWTSPHRRPTPRSRRGTAVHPVVRSAASVRVSSTEASPVELLGRRARRRSAGVRSWGHVVGGARPGRPRPRACAAPSAPVGGALPAGARRVDVPATRRRRPAAAHRVVAAGGRSRRRGRPDADQPTGFGAQLPVGADVGTGSSAGRALFALTLAEATGYATREQHHNGEGVTSLNVLGGRVVLVAARVRGAAGWSTAVGAGDWTGWGATLGGDSVTAPATDRPGWR